MKKIIAALSLLLSTAAVVGAQDGHVRVLITTHGESRPDLVKDAGGEIVLSSPDGKLLVARMPLGRVAGLRAHDAIAAVEEDQPVMALGGPPSAPQPAQQTFWNILAIKADQVSVTGAGITVAIIDTGILADHPDLKGRVVLGPNYVSPKKTAIDDNGHGTHCAGIVGAGNNSIGVVGVAPGCTLLAIKALDRNGSGNLSGVVLGINYAVESGAKVLSLSLGSTGTLPSLGTAVANASVKAVVCAAAGNDGQNENPISYPGAYEGAICVASTDQAGKRSSFSTSGPQVDLAAPGSGIFSTYLNNGYQTLSGTSMATPHVAGAAALLFSNGSTQASTVRANLEASASLDGNRTNDLGFGLIDVLQALALPK